MLNNNQYDQIQNIIRSLSVNEAKLLYLRCLGLSVTQSATVMGYSDEWVNKQMRNLYTVFGFAKVNSYSARLQALRHIICPIYSTYIGGYGYTLEDPIWNQWPDIEIKREIEPVIGYMVLSDNEELKKEPPNQIPKWLVSRENESYKRIENTLPRRSFGFITILVILAVIGGGTFFLLWSLLNFELPQRPEPTRIVLSTNTPKPEITQEEVSFLATSTTAPEFKQPPNIELPFEENFDKDIESPWTYMGTRPNVVDGKLTTGGESWIFTGSSLTDVRIEILQKGHCTTSGLQWSNALAVRVKDYKNMIAVKWDGCLVEMFIVSDGNWESVPGTRTGMRNTYNAYDSIVFEIVDNHVLFLVNSKLVKEIFVPSETILKFASGGIGLRIHERADPYVDLIRVTEAIP